LTQQPFDGSTFTTEYAPPPVSKLVGTKLAEPLSPNPPFPNSYWVAPGLFLAGPFPGDLDTGLATAKLKALAQVGIRTVVNLQPEEERGGGGAAFPDLTASLSGLGINVSRFPIADMDVPGTATLSTILDTIDEEIARGKAVYVHCWGGHGRTGVVVGCWLQRHALGGKAGTLARIKELRVLAGINSASPQTRAQCDFVKAWPSPEAMPLSNRLAGAVWGALIGDALGVPYEFQPGRRSESVVWGTSGTHGQPPGTWSDDGGLLLALLDSLLAAGFDIRDQGERSLRWLNGPDYKPGHVFDVGIATRKALSAIHSGVPADIAGGRSEIDNGNGSLMRILPIALLANNGPAQVADWAQRASSVTHGHMRSRLTCALYCLVARRLLEGQLDRRASLAGALADLRAVCSPEDRDELELIASYPKRTGSGYVVDTFWSAWDAFASASSYEGSVKAAVAYGSDTDTTACVAGGLAGIYWGVSGIPSTWLITMRGSAIVGQLIDRLLNGSVKAP